MLNTKLCGLNLDRGNELTNVRENLAQLGKSLPLPLYIRLQAFLTWLTGKPHKGQQPLFRSSRNYELVTALATLFGSAMVSSLILQSSPIVFPLLSISWLVTVGSARKIQACLIHRCVHYQFFGDKRDRILAELLSTLIFTQGFDGYRQDHVKCHHHIDKFATFEGDPDAKFILAVGFHPSL